MEIQRREAGFQQIKQLLEEKIENSTCCKFGSAATYLFIPNADIDLVLLNRSISTSDLFQKAKKVISKSKTRFENVEFIESARVPLIKFFDKESGYEFDLCFNEEGGLVAIAEINQAIATYPEIKYIFLLLKIFLRQRRMHSSYTGGLGSFLLFCMVLHFSREYRDKIVYNFGIDAIKKITLAEILLQFLNYYGSEFNNINDEIVITSAPYIRKKKQKTMGFSLISPQDPEQNLGGACFKFYEIFKVFKNRYNFMTNVPNEKGQSILKHLINPSERVFKKYEKN